MHSPMQHFLERYVYRAKEPPPRVRDPSRPMQVICPGFPRTGTETLQQALLKLGYDYTYHGWDICFEEPNYMQAWVRLVTKKWHGSDDGESNITAADFDKLLGHSVAVTDTAASVFARELIEAYPDAKVILNGRQDLEAWHQSAIKNPCSSNESWPIYLISWFTGPAFWTYIVYGRMMWPYLFRATPGQDMSQAIRKNGKWIYREHYDMIRGLVPKENLLEWKVEDGWEPLCQFLGKEIPDEPLPKTNDTAAFAGRVEGWMTENKRLLARNFGIFTAVVAITIGAGTWRFAPNRTAATTSWLRHSFQAARDMLRR